MSDTIRITGLTLRGFHGVFEEEKRDGQTFIVDLVIELDASHAQHTDSLEHTVDYSQVVDQVAAVVTGEPVDLIETLAHNVATVVLGFEGVAATTVTVHKPEAPVGHPVSDISFTTRAVREVS